MSIMSDRWITRMATEHGMIEPFEGRQVRQGVISYGVSSYGYDMRVAREFRIGKRATYIACIKPSALMHSNPS